MSNSKKKKGNYLKRSVLLPYLLSSFFLLVCAVILFNSYYLRRVFPNVSFGSVSYSGLLQGEVKTELTRQLKTSGLILNSNNKTYEYSFEDLGIKIEEEVITNNIFTYGRSGNFWEDIKVQISSSFRPMEIEASYEIDFDKFLEQVNKDLEADDKSAKNAKIIFQNGGFDVVESQSGLLVDRAQLAQDLKARIKHLSRDPVEIRFVEAKPVIETAQLEAASERLENISKRKVTITFGFDKWSLAGDSLIGVLNLDKWEEFDRSNIQTLALKSPISISGIIFSDSRANTLDISFSEDNINEFVGVIAKSVDRPARDATLRFDGGKVVEFSAAVDGQAVDTESLKTSLLRELTDVGSEEDQIAISLPVSITKARIDNSEINSLGIRELVGRGVSYFAGSIPNRAFNIGLGAKLISGTLVKPGDTFSFTSIVGPVSAEQGFKQAYVINKGRTVLDDGGGICQVSTTVFRAALNSGLPIVKRTAHAYRVSYYEQRGFKAGLDATIFSPTVDLQFKNDTGHHLLVQAVVDNANSKIEVDIYGTSDGRRVELGDPVVSNLKPAPEPLYQDDPSLPKGTTKQVDFAVQGATAVFGRKVFKGAELIIDDSFKSVYRPWQAVYLVGTG